MDDQRRIAVRAVVAVNTTIVVDDHRAGGHRVGTRDRQKVRSRSGRHRPCERTLIAGTAIGFHVEVIHHRRQVGNRVRIAVGLHFRAAAGREAGRTIFDDPVAGSAVLRPAQRHRILRHVVNGQVGGLRASGGDAQHQVVDITLVVVGTGHERSDVIGGHQGETVASASETAREEDLRRVGRRTGIDNHRVNRSERAHIRAGHRTNHETERIRGAVTAGIEGELQVVNRIGIDIQSGQNGILVSIA